MGRLVETEESTLDGSLFGIYFGMDGKRTGGGGGHYIYYKS
jgi:hypothetical protein